MNGHADYIDLPNGKRMELSASIVKVTIDGKTYETSWANVVLVEE